MHHPILPKPEILHLPPGFRFHPTDQELVLQYLKRKAFSLPLPASIIPEIDLTKYNPWNLPGFGKQEKYFFYLRAVKIRAMCSGQWKVKGKEKPIIASKSNEIVGMKRVFVFYLRKLSGGVKTDWVMHEYCLAGESVCCFGKRNNVNDSSVQYRKEWVLCRIFLKRRANKKESNGLIHQKSQSVIQFINSLREERGNQSRRNSFFSSLSSSELSCVTENNEEVSSQASTS